MERRAVVFRRDGLADCFKAVPFGCRAVSQPNNSRAWGADSFLTFLTASSIVLMPDTLATKLVWSKWVLCSALLAEGASRRGARLYPVSAQQACVTGRVKSLLGDGEFPVQDETKNSHSRAGQNQREQANRPFRQSQQAQLFFVRDWKNSNDEKWVVRPTMEFLGRAQKEMQIDFQKLIHVFLPDFRQCHPFVAISSAAAIPKQLPRFPIQNLHFTFLAVSVLKAVRKLERQLGHQVERLPPGVSGEQFALIRVAAHLVHFGLIPLTVILLPDEIQDFCWLKNSQRKFVGVAASINGSSRS
jgi:hypothetical protein